MRSVGAQNGRPMSKTRRTSKSGVSRLGRARSVKKANQKRLEDQRVLDAIRTLPPLPPLTGEATVGNAARTAKLGD